MKHINVNKIGHKMEQKTNTIENQQTTHPSNIGKPINKQRLFSVQFESYGVWWYCYMLYVYGIRYTIGLKIDKLT